MHRCNIKQLQRPVQTPSVDLNNVGKNNFLVYEFGYLTGALSWYQAMGNDQFERHTIREISGAIKAYVTDNEHDALPDIWALFAQGDEGIFLFTDKGHGNFEEEKILGFPPSYGCSYFELDDFNKDGYPDIHYTCGNDIAAISFFTVYIHQPDEGFIYLENKGNFDFLPYSIRGPK